MILVTGMYSVTPEGQYPIVNTMEGVEPGPIYTQSALDTVFPGFGALFLSVAIFFFAFTTLMAYYYIAETTIIFLNRKQKYPWLLTTFKVVFLAMVFFGTVRSASLMWALGDIGFGSMAWLNMFAILLLTKPALKVLKDFDNQMKAGENPVFDPVKAGIKNAEFWEERNKSDTSDKKHVG